MAYVVSVEIQGLSSIDKGCGQSLKYMYFSEGLFVNDEIW